MRGHFHNQYSSGDDFGFTKTVIPVRLAQSASDRLISRSQAKRILARVQFKVAVLDFENVESIGQPFADQVFRVFKRAHPEIELYAINVSSTVQHAIDIASSAATHPSPGSDYDSK
jgi:hypothetical protein